MESLRKATGSDRYIAEIECQREFSKRLGSNFKLALIMTTREYIVILLGLWLVMVYVVVFWFLQRFDYVFQDTYNFSRGLVGMSFAAIAVGLCLNTALGFWYAINHKKRAERWHRETNDNEELPPEYRMIPAFPLAFTFPVSLFWLGWSNYSSISPWYDLGAAALFGFSWAGIYVVIY